MSPAFLLFQAVRALSLSGGGTSIWPDPTSSRGSGWGRTSTMKICGWCGSRPGKKNAPP